MIFKKITSTDKNELPLLLSGIKNYNDTIKFIQSKNEDIEVFTNENLGKKNKNDVKQEDNTSTSYVNALGVQMDANKPNRHLGSPVGGVIPNKIPMSDEEAEKAAMFKKVR